MPALVDVPTNELVAAAWLKLVVGDIVGTTLPNAEGWAETGFVVVSTVGGSPNMDYPLRSPVVSADCWATKLGSNRPPYGMANALAESIVAAAQDPTMCQMLVDLPRELGQVRVQSVWPLGEPRRAPSDAASYAHYTLDLGLVWSRS